MEEEAVRISASPALVPGYWGTSSSQPHMGLVNSTRRPGLELALALVNSSHSSCSFTRLWCFPLSARLGGHFCGPDYPLSSRAQVRAAHTVPAPKQSAANQRGVPAPAVDVCRCYCCHGRSQRPGDSCSCTFAALHGGHGRCDSWGPTAPAWSRVMGPNRRRCGARNQQRWRRSAGCSRPRHCPRRRMSRGAPCWRQTRRRPRRSGAPQGARGTRKSSGADWLGAPVARAVPAPALARPPGTHARHHEDLGASNAQVSRSAALHAARGQGHACRPPTRLAATRRLVALDVPGQPTPLHLVRADEGDLRHCVRESRRYQPFQELERQRPGTVGGLGGAVRRPACRRAHAWESGRRSMCPGLRSPLL